MFESVLRFVVAATVLLAVGIGGSSLLSARFGPRAATYLQRLTVVGVVLAALLSCLPLPRVAAPLITVAPPPPLPVLPEPSAIDLPTVPVASVRLPAPLPTPEQPVPLRLIALKPFETIALVAILGTFIFLCRLAFGSLYLIGLYRRSTVCPSDSIEFREWNDGAPERPVPVRRIGELSSPLLAGVLRPSLYLPQEANYTSEERQAVFAHERMHLERNDLGWNLTVKLLRALLWWHPLVPLLDRRMLATAEEACDAAAVGKVGSASRYADFLLRLAEHPAPRPALALQMATFRSATGQRIARLLRPLVARPLTRRMMTGLGLGTVGVILLAVSLIGSRSEAQNPLHTPGYAWNENDFRELTAGDPPLISHPSVAASPMTIVVFEDFQCPSCRRNFNGLIRADLLGRYRVLFRHLPLNTMHDRALPAALAVEAARNQGKFTEMCKALFENEADKLTEDDLRRCARRVGLDMVRFEKDCKSPSLRTRIDADIKLAEKFNIRSTPTFVLRTPTGKFHKAIGSKELREILSDKGLSPNELTSWLMERDPISVKNRPVREVLAELLKDCPFPYRIDPGIGGNVSAETAEGSDRGLNFTVLGRNATPSFVFVPREDALVFRITPPSGRITGKVTYEDGRPAAGILVGAQVQKAQARTAAATGQYSTSCRTDSDGSYTLVNLGPYPYNIAVRFGEIVSDEPEPFVAVAQEGILPQLNATTTVAPLVLTQGVIVRGTVRDAKGKPEARMWVGVQGPHHPESGEASSTVRTNAQGRYTLRVAPGANIFSVAWPTYHPSARRVTVRPGETKTVDFIAVPKPKDSPMVRAAPVDPQTIDPGIFPGSTIARWNPDPQIVRQLTILPPNRRSTDYQALLAPTQ